MATRKGASRVIFETDSVAALQILYAHIPCPPTVLVVLKRCWTLLARLAHRKVVAIRREANVLADSVAAYAASHRQQWLWLDACPWLSKDGCFDLC